MLGRIPEEFYPEISASDAQREEWVQLFAIDEIAGVRWSQEIGQLVKRLFRKGLSGRCQCDSRKVVETDLEPPCGRRPPESSIAARHCVIRLI